MTRSKTRNSESCNCSYFFLIRHIHPLNPESVRSLRNVCVLTLGLHLALVPTQYEFVPFHVRALKILLHELQNTAEADKPKLDDAQSDDGVSCTNATPRCSCG